MNPLLVRPSALLAKLETTKGTAESLTTAEGVFNVFDVDFKETTPFIERPKQGGAGYLKGVPGAMMGTCSFRVHLENSGTATVPAWATVFLAACGYVNSGGTFTRTLDTSAQSTATIAHFKGAGTSSIKQTLTGATGTARIVYHNGAPADVNFTFTGKYTSEATATLLDPTEPTTLPPRGWESATINSVSIMAPEITLDLGQTVKLLEGPNDTTDSGYVHGIISDYKAKLTTEPYQEALSVIDWRAAYVAGTEWPLSIVAGSGSNNVVTVTASKLQLVAAPGFGNREQVYTRQLEFLVNDDSGPILAFS